MINYYKTTNGVLENLDLACQGSWVHLIDPSKEELQKVSQECSVEMDLLSAALDEEETPRIEKEEDQTLILVDIPVVEPEGTSFLYNTMPAWNNRHGAQYYNRLPRRDDDNRRFLQEARKGF